MRRIRKEGRKDPESRTPMSIIRRAGIPGRPMTMAEHGQQSAGSSIGLSKGLASWIVSPERAAAP